MNESNAAARATGQQVEIVDVNGNVIEVVVHQRAPWKDVAPSLWDLAFGGVCDVGEAHLDIEQLDD